MSSAPESDRSRMARDLRGGGGHSGSGAPAGEGASDDVHARDVRRCTRQGRVVARPQRSRESEQVWCSD